MKKYNSPLRYVALLIVAAAGLWACNSEGSEPVINITRIVKQTVEFHAYPTQTKTAFGEGQEGVYPVLWTANDASVKISMNYLEARVAAVTPSEDYRSADFSAEFNTEDSTSPFVFYAVSPASAARALSASRKAWSISIPAVQTPLEGSVDEAAMILVSASKSYEQLPQAADLHFNHITAYGRMSFTNLALEDAKVQKVEITATTPLVGDWYWESDGDNVLTDNGASSTITLKTSSISDIWFACAPVDVSGQILVFTVYTDKGVFIKEVEMPQGTCFQSGHIAVFGVDMKDVELGGGGNGSFVLMTAGATFKEGDQIIIANQEGTYALGPQAGTDKKPIRERVAITTANGKITAAGDATVFTLEKGNESDTWALRSESGYLCTLSSGNYLTESAKITNNSSWSITIMNPAEATIVAAAGESKFIRENKKDTRFSAYKSSSSLQDPLAVYCSSGATPAPVEDDPLEQYSQFGFYRDANSRVYEPGADQYCRSYSADGVQTFTILNPAQNEQLEISGYKKSLVKGDMVTLSVSWRKGKSYVVKNQAFKLSLVKEDGPVVWLGDGSGNGFIIKK